MPPERTTDRKSTRLGGMSMAMGPRMATAMALLCSHVGVPRYFKLFGLFGLCVCSGVAVSCAEGSEAAMIDS